MTAALKDFMAQYQTRLEQVLSAHLSPLPAHRTRLIEAMGYSALGGGKRMRPLLAYAAAAATGGINPVTDDFAAALECLHVYSLIHDDLPAMDDDALRRGKATCHIAFDEATAILAGDALQCLAFELLAQCRAATDSQRLAAIARLARAAGARGMVLGQAIDLDSVAKQPSLSELENMHRHKTGALIEASTALGGISANASAEDLTRLEIYSRAVGLAFQVQDDILDVTADTGVLGKTQGADRKRNKPTYVSLLGLQGARDKAEELRQQALDALAPFGERGSTLGALAHYVVDRAF